MINVEIRHGKHSTRAPKGMDLSIADFLRKFVPENNYLVHLGAQIRGSAYKQGEVKSLRIKGNTLTLAVQSGGKNTRFEAHVVLDGLDAQEIFGKMIHDESREFIVPQKEQSDEMNEFVEADVSAQLIEEPFIQEEKAMETKKANEENSLPARFKVKENLANTEFLQLTLIFLSEQQEKEGYVDASVCNMLLMESKLLGSIKSKKSLAILYSTLVKMGYLEKSEKPKHYLISEKSRDLLHPARTPAIPSIIAGSEIGKKRQMGHRLIDELLETESRLFAASSLIKEAERALSSLLEEERKSKEKIEELADQMANIFKQ
jgi:hypothetical protein